MRSKLVFEANQKVQNRYQLTRLTALAARKLHTPTTTVGQTINKVLTYLGENKAPDEKGQFASSNGKNGTAILVIVSARETSQKQRLRAA